MSEIKNYKIIKTTPTEVLFNLHPVSNPMLTREVYLTNKQPECAVPQDWALGVFADSGAYSLFRKGLITFDDPDSITKAAFEAGVYFNESLDFTPSSKQDVEKILAVLKEGNREKINQVIQEYSADRVKEVLYLNKDGLSLSVVRILENLLGCQLIMDEQ